MWNTSRGMRVLTGHEATLVREIVSVMVDSIRNEATGFDFPADTGVGLFDRLSWTQRLTLLNQVASALLLPSETISAHSSVHDAAVAAIYSAIEDCVAIEIDMGDDFYWRTLVRNAYRSCFETDSTDSKLLPKTLGDQREDRWSFVILLLTDCILHDRDFAAADSFLDLAPDKAADLRQILGINETYYVDVSDDVRDADAESLFRQIKQLTAVER